MSSKNIDLLATVANLYYNFNQSQAQIASRFDLSPSKVSRLIKEARERGIVEIHVHMPIPRDLELEQILMRDFCLKDAYVLKTSADTDDGLSLETLGKLAAIHLERVIDALPAEASIGVAWGTDVHSVVNALSSNPSRQIDVVQLLGGVGSMLLDSPELGRTVAAKLGGHHHDLHAPFLVEKETARDAFLAEPVVQESFRRAKSVGLAIIGVGSVEDEASSFLRAGLVTRSNLAQLRVQGAVGEVCGQFIDINGCNDEFEINRRIIAISLDDLRYIPRVIAIAHGLPKAASILAAMRGKFLNALVTDDITAQAIIELAKTVPPAPDPIDTPAEETLP